MIKSKICTKSDFDTEDYRKVLLHFNEEFRYHRKPWEIVSTIQVLQQFDMLDKDKIGLGFACGEESTPSVIAKLGGKALCTDRDPKVDNTWEKSGQQASNKKSIHKEHIVDYNTFDNNIDFEYLDMNEVPAKYFGKFDYVWSTCAIEHLGSIKHGLYFVMNSLACLKPGGVAIHTTEYNLSSNENTLESPDLSFFRKRDILELIDLVEYYGYTVHKDPNMFARGTHEYDLYVDETYKYKEPIVHINLRIDKYNMTGIRLIISK
jgi:SAM-dependent methyltransferase